MNLYDGDLDAKAIRPSLPQCEEPFEARRRLAIDREKWRIRGLHARYPLCVGSEWKAVGVSPGGDWGALWLGATIA